MKRCVRLLGLIIALLFAVGATGQNVVIVIVDGARYTETFGDASHTYIPRMWELAQQGTYIDAFNNDSFTYTSAAIPAIWCGTWTDREDVVHNGSNTQYTVQPTLFEYYRKQKNIPQEQCLYSLKYVSSLWLQSFHAQYGSAYWPYTISLGSNDSDVLQNSLSYMLEHHPTFSVVYFADVDGAGHSGNWDNYVEAIETADQCVGELWDGLQADPFYANNTIMFVTNDHGRHDDANGGFRGHGCGCQGCRQIMFLAVGTGIKEGFVSGEYRRVPDVAVTAASVLDVDMEYATGQVMAEIFTATAASANYKPDRSFEVQVTTNGITIDTEVPGKATVTVFDMMGRSVAKPFTNIQVNEQLRYPYPWNKNMPQGNYIIRVEMEGVEKSVKITVQ